MPLIGKIDCHAPGHNLNQKLIKEIIKNKENYIIEETDPLDNSKNFLSFIERNNPTQDISFVA